MSAPRSSGTRIALLIGLPVLALGGAVYLVAGDGERPVPRPPGPARAELGESPPPERTEEPSAEQPPGRAAAAAATAQQEKAPPAADPEARVIERMRAALADDPEEVLRLDDAAARDFGDSPRAAERGLLRTRALVRLNRAGEARSLAEELIERYPHDPSAQSAAAYMGVHPRPRGPSR